MRKVTEILGVPIDKVTMEEAVQRTISYFDTSKSHMIFTPNPEIVMAAQKNDALFKILKQADLVVPDGIGVVIGSKFQREKLTERVAGYDLVQNLFLKMKNLDKTVYFLGGKPGVVEMAKEKMEEKYPGLKIIGVKNGYFNEEEERSIIIELKEKKPDLLLVGLGAPKQEIWINKYKDQLDSKVMIGVGGSFDVMAGVVKRAPKFFQNLGLEWFYRLITQPTRAIRMMQLPIFLICVMRESISSGRK